MEIENEDVLEREYYSHNPPSRMRSSLKPYTSETEQQAANNKEDDQQENFEEPTAPAEVGQEPEPTPEVERNEVRIESMPIVAEPRAAKGNNNQEVTK